VVIIISLFLIKVKKRYPATIYTVGILVFILLTISSVGAYEIEFPPKGGLNVKLLGKITENYSNNITFASNEEEKIEGLLTTATLGLGIQYSGKRRVIGFNGQAYWQIPTKSLSVQNSSENINFSFQEEFSEYDIIALSDTYSHSQVPENFDEEFGRGGGRFDSYNNTANIDYRREISGDVAANLGYSYGSSRFSREGSLDSTQNTGKFGLNYIYSSATNFSISYSLSDYNYDGGDNISIQSFTTSIRRYITKNLYVNGTAGVAISTRKNDKNRRVNYSVEISGELDDETNAILSYAKGIQTGVDKDDVFDNWQVSGRFTRQLLEDLSSNLSLSYGEGTYDLTGIKDKLVVWNALVSYKFWENKKGADISGRLGYTYSKLNTTDIGRGYTRNSLEMGMAAGF